MLWWRSSKSSPEHQRVNLTVTLTNNALVFEKELKANGVTENRHYLQAAGMTFALVMS